MIWDDFWRAQTRPTIEMAGRHVVRSFSDTNEEYAALRTAAGVVDRSFWARIELTGADRLSWLHNFTTNQIKTLGSGDGNYCFALNGAGRIQFDLHALIRPDRIWLVVDARRLEPALAHLNKYIIMEDVRVARPQASAIQIGIAGPRAGAVLAGIGAEGAAAMALEQSSQFSWRGQVIELFRSDFCGVRGYELFVPDDLAVTFWQAVTQDADVRPCGWEAAETCRIEAGLPDGLADLAGDVLPGETGQFERAVSFSKGCYLGQEIVERMRSRSSVARRLVGLSVDAPALPPAGAQVVTGDDRRAIGKLTSSCHSPALGGFLGLAILKLAHTEPGTSVSIATDDAVYPAHVMRLPIVAPD